MDSCTFPIRDHIRQHRHELSIYVGPREYAIESIISETNSGRPDDQYCSVWAIGFIYDVF